MTALWRSGIPLSEPHCFGIAIVGAGASGVMVAAQIARQSRAAGVAMPSVLLIDGDGQPGRGVAYGTAREEHVLNVPASGMSAFPDQLNHFVDWLLEQGEDEPGLGHRFLPRRVYGHYLQAQLAQATQCGVEMLRDRVVAIADVAPYRLGLASGSNVAAKSVVLAIGNSAHALPVRHDDVLVVEGWDDEALGLIPIDDDIAIVGAGLSMVDAALTLSASGHRGRIEVFSRHGLAPLGHDDAHDIADIDVDALVALPLRQRLHQLRQVIAANPHWHWQAVMRSLRAPGQRLWQSLSATDQQRFLRHVVRYWDIHRHRIAPHVAATLDAMRQSGQLTLHAGRPLALRQIDGRIVVDFVTRHETRRRRVRVDRVINATGLETHFEQSSDPLIRALLASGNAKPGPHGRGFDTDADGRLLDRVGTLQANLYTLGSPRIGSLWESIAIPDLRVQAANLATHLVHASSLLTREGDRD